VSAHVRAAELIPWLVNKRLDGDDLEWLMGHLHDCRHCQAMLESERRIHAAVNASDTIEYAPQASFNRLWSRIDSSNRAAENGASVAPPDARRSPVWLQLAASVLLAVGMGALLWQWQDTAPAPAFRTVTSRATPAPAGSLKVIFDAAATSADVRLVLGAAELTVLAGPSSTGVYTVVSATAFDQADLDASLKSLRSDPRVRFAERSVRSD
jgi:hypothetical protein